MPQSSRVLELTGGPLHEQFQLLARLGITQLVLSGEQLSARPCFYLWTYGLLRRIAAITVPCRDEVLRRLIAQDTTFFPDPDTATFPRVRLALADDRWLTGDFCHGEYLDCQTGIVAVTLPPPPVKSVIYDLGVLCGQNTRHCEQPEGPNDPNKRA